jgi:Rap1a immunity proteins
MMRTTIVAAWVMLALWPLQAGAQVGVADVDDFTLDTAQNLLDLCATDESSPVYGEAMSFCAGFLEGMKHYHDSLASGPEGKPIVCVPDEVTLSEAIDIYVTYGRANPQYLGEAPADNVIRAAIAQWPCS